MTLTDYPPMVILFVFIATSALASDWRLLDVGQNVRVYVDKESVRFSGSTAKAWVKFEYRQPEKVRDKTYVMSKSLSIYKCVDRTSAMIQEIYYSDLDGREVVDGHVINESRALFSEVIPGTLGEIFLQWVCNKMPRKK